MTIEPVEHLGLVSNVTIYAVKPVIQILKSEVLMDNEEDTQLTKDIKNHILAYVDNK